jgi:predicted nucleic acid-binding protein
MAERIVINTGPLITLARMEALDVPGQLAYEFICPQEVQAELEAGARAGHPVMNPFWKHWRRVAL